MKWLAGFLVIGLLLAGCGNDDGGDAALQHRKVKPDPQCGRNPENFERCKLQIALYCEYGAVSRAQLHGCQEHRH